MLWVDSDCSSQAALRQKHAEARPRAIECQCRSLETYAIEQSGKCRIFQLVASEGNWIFSAEKLQRGDDADCDSVCLNNAGPVEQRNGQLSEIFRSSPRALKCWSETELAAHPAKSNSCKISLFKFGFRKSLRVLPLFQQIRISAYL